MSNVTSYEIQEKSNMWLCMHEGITKDMELIECSQTYEREDNPHVVQNILFKILKLTTISGSQIAASCRVVKHIYHHKQKPMVTSVQNCHEVCIKYFYRGRHI